MADLPFAVKYRPRSLAGLIGQDVVVQFDVFDIIAVQPASYLGQMALQQVAAFGREDVRIVRPEHDEELDASASQFGDELLEV